MTKRSVVVEEDYFSSICSLFNESQFHVSSHRKNIQSLRKLHAKAAESGHEAEVKFLQSFCHCLHVILGMKKADDVSSKLMRFLVGFIVRSADSVVKEPATGQFVDRFIEGLMRHVLDHLDAKEKLVRARLCQIMVACLNSIQELTDEIWNVFRVKMTERLFDKEASVRVHAIHSMSRLQSLPIEDDSQMTIMDIFIDLLQHDPSPDVRKAALLQIAVCPQSIPAILERRRDVDTLVRRMFYSKKMAEIDVNTDLTIQQREEVLKSGLTDREQSVRQACTEMVFEHWMAKAGGNLIQFLVGLDVVAHVEVAEIALKAFFEKIPNMLEGNFTDQFLQSMTAEMAFTLRAYCEHQIASTRSTEIVTEILPELSVMNGYLRAKYDAIVTCSDDVVRAELEFVLNELLKVCNWLDFSDEVGRRAVFDTCQEIMSNLEICDAVYEQCIKLLTKHSSNTEEFLNLMTTFISSFRDVYELSPTTAAAAANQDHADELIDNYIPDDVRIMANLKALEIVRSVLCASGEAITFARFPILVAYLDEIVIPSVNSQFAAVQAAGLVCLGLCCTIEKGLALEYMPLFCDFYRLGHEDGRACALKIIFDLLFLYGRDFFADSAALEVATSALYDDGQDSAGAIQNIAAEGFSKLFLHRIISDEAVLEGLFRLYLHPSTSGSLKQCLSYFFQAFAFTSPASQVIICGLVGRVLGAWSQQNYQQLSLANVAAQLNYLCDPQNLLPPAQALLPDYAHQYAQGHAQTGIDLCWAILASLGTDTGKPLIAQLTKLPLSPLPPGRSELKALFFLLRQLHLYVTDKTSANALAKLFTTVINCLGAEDTQLDPALMEEMKARLQKSIPANAVVSTTATMTTTMPVSKKAKLAHQPTENIMDEITDLLDNE